MFKKLFVAAVLAAGSVAVAPAFASSGYGPAPHYNPLAGAPASQRGQSALTVRAEQSDLMADADVTSQSYGGMPDTTSQSGAYVAQPASFSSYAHH